MDSTEALRERVLQALERGTPLDIQGGGSKSFYGRPARGEPLSMLGHRGLIQYEPTELVITARAGTPLAELEALLREQNQMFPFEPPHFDAPPTTTASLGGTVACGLSGPRRPFAGSLRDAVLGVKLINGKGEVLSFGGQVIKNVAGFDVSRLQAGAMGSLGVLLEVSLKVAARPEAEETRVFEMDAEQALSSLAIRCGQPWPLSAACHDGKRLYLRLSGAEAALRACREKLGGELLPEGDAFWAGLREQRLDFFASPLPLWRISLAPASPAPDLPGACFIDWGGALRWVKTDAPPSAVFQAARQAGGQASLFRHGDRENGLFQPLPERLLALHREIKKAFDPHGLFNPGRLYEAW